MNVKQYKLNYRLAIFDMDGVITETRKTHEKAWKKSFDAFIEHWNTENNKLIHKFILPDDYESYVDGRTRKNGVITFLKSRKIQLPEGEKDDTTLGTVNGICNRKNKLFLEILKSEGIKLFDDSLRLIKILKENDILIGLATSSKNSSHILRKLKIYNLFDFILDGNDIDTLGLNSKPESDIFLRIAECLNIKFSKCLVFEDSYEALHMVNKHKPYKAIGLDRSEGMIMKKKFSPLKVFSNLDDPLLLKEELKIL